MTRYKTLHFFRIRFSLKDFLNGKLRKNQEFMMAENNQTVPRIIREKKLLTEDNKIIYLTSTRIISDSNEIFHFFLTYFFDDF